MGLSRLFLILGLFLLLFFGWRSISGGGSELQPIRPVPVVHPEGERPPEQHCDLWTEHFRARISSRGGALQKLQVLPAKYRRDGEPIDLVTTPDHPHLNPLFTAFRNPTAIRDDHENWLVQQDVLDWRIVRSTATSCELEFRDATVALTRTIEAGRGPYELSVKTTVENLSDRKRHYALIVSTTDFRRDDEVEGAMFTMNPLNTHVECVAPDGDADRRRRDDFDASDFEKQENFPRTELTDGSWFQSAGNATLAAVSNAYFTNAIFHDQGPAAPLCQLQIEERWHVGQYRSKSADPNSAALYKARLAYPVRTLAPGQSESFEHTAFIGPKERQALETAGPQFVELIDLGFFSSIARVLVSFLLKVYSLIPNWGVAIIVLTITARLLLFPLSVPSIKNMVHMRELKPEMDALNEKFKDDPQAKGLAQMELWRKHGVNPMKGCLPQLASMPVWVALYTTLQTAVELYNIPFLWFPDLSRPDPYYALPFIIGGVFFLQQKLMPMQAGDPTQQKIMMYFMPGMFTVFMLFLPAGLGVYMFTNSLLGILQQQVVERHVQKTLKSRKEQPAPSSSGATPKRKTAKRSGA